LGELGQLPAVSPFVAYSIWYADLEVELGFPVPYLLPEKGDITSSCLPAGKVAFLYVSRPLRRYDAGVWG
jgi:hypothetical protein